MRPFAQLSSRLRLELAAVVIVAAGVSFHFRGHFVVPQSDFHEFANTGHRLLDGELPRTFKRAPLFPLIVAGGGRCLGMASSIETPDQVFAEWFNACIVPVNAALVLLIARGWKGGGGARWTALWTVLTPLSVWCAAHVIVEAPLVCAILLTILLAQRGSVWAYLAAMLAMVLRYDACGVLVGLIVWDLLRRQALWRVALRAIAAAAPVGAWLALTWVYWNPDDGEHYVAQIRSHARVGVDDLVWALKMPFATLLEPLRFSYPVIAAVGPALEWLIAAMLYAAAAVGAAALAWRRDGGALVLLSVYVGYALVHAVFPFREERFAYPMAPLVQLAVAIGAALIGRAALSGRTMLLAGRPLLVVGVAIVCFAVANEVAACRAAGAQLEARSLRFSIAAGAGIALVWLTGAWPWRGAALRLVVLAAVLAAGSMHVRAIVARMGSGRELANLVEAARWIRDPSNTSPTERVASAMPGLLQMYAGSEPRGRFVGLQRIEADRWPEMLRECREKQIVFIIWHDRVIADAGAHYIAEWRLERFAPLDDDPTLGGKLRIEKTFVGEPNVRILRVKPGPGGPTSGPRR